MFEVKGVDQSDFFELSSGIIQITEGTNFAEEQLADGSHVALISQELADANGLWVGSTITLEEIVSQGGDNPASWFDDDNIVDHLAIDFEVIGIYNLQASLNEFSDVIAGDLVFPAGNRHIVQELNMLNLIYIPYGVLEQIINFGVVSISNLSIDNFLILNDPRDLPAFHESAADILPEFITTTDVTASFENVFGVMNQISEVSIFILIFLIGASLLLLSFLIMLLLRNRRSEIGIYLALGEQKWRISFQFIVEVLVITIIAITLSLFANQAVSAQISQHMVRQEMASVQVHGPQIVLEIPGIGFFSQDVSLLDWLVPEVQEIEEIIEAFDISLEVIDILAFYGATILIAMSSTIVSNAYVMRLKPKEVLLEI